MTTITAILPAYNEEISIGSVVLYTRKYADRVLVIDDGSTDRSAEMAEMADRQIAQRFTGSYAPSGPMTPEVIRHPNNMGKGAALRTGFTAANGADVIMALDTDGQHDPAEIPTLTAPILAGEADMVNGSQYISDNVKNQNPYYFVVPCKEMDNT